MTEKNPGLPDTPLTRSAVIIFNALEDSGSWDELSRDRQMVYVDVAQLVGRELGAQFSACGDDAGVLAERALCIVEALHITETTAIDRIADLVHQAGADRARVYLASRDEDRMPF